MTEITTFDRKGTFAPALSNDGCVATDNLFNLSKVPFPPWDNHNNGGIHDTEGGFE